MIQNLDVEVNSCNVITR